MTEEQLPDTKFYVAMAAGHQIRKGHPLQAVLVSADGILWQQVNKCCQEAAEQGQQS